MTPHPVLARWMPVAPEARASVRRQLQQWALWLLMLLLVAGVQAWQLSAAHERTRLDQEARLRQQARLASQALERQVVAIDAGLRSVVADLPRWQARGDSTSLTGRLKALEAAFAGIRMLMVVDEAGRVLAASREGQTEPDVAALPYFARARSDNRAALLYVAAPYRSRSGVWSLNLVRVLQHPDGRFAGVVAATLDPAWLAVTMGSINYAADMWTGLTHTGGVLLFLAPAPTVGLEGANLARPGSMFSRHLAAGQVETLLQGRIAITGQGDRVIVQRTLQPAGLPLDGNLVIGTSRRLAGMYVDWREHRDSAIVLTLLLAVLSAAGLALLQRAERRRAQAVQASEQRWLLALQSSGLGVWEFDPRSGAAFFSPLWRQLVGIADTEPPPVLDSWWKLLHPDDRESTLQGLQQHLSGEQPEFRAAFRLHCADGSWRWMAACGRVVARDAGGQPARVIGTMTDIQAQREAEALRAENARMQASLAAKTSFLSQMNHEVRTPLHAVLGFGEIVRQRLGQRQQDDLLPYMDQVLRGGRLLLDMMSDMLEYTRLDSHPAALNVEAVALPELLHSVLDKMAPAAQARQVTLLPGPCHAQARVLADPARLRRVLETLLDNAVAYNRQGGEVRLSCEPVAGGAPAWLVRISDTGCGMSAEELQHLFEPMYRGRHAGSKRLGAGLGLALARWYLQRMGATLAVRSEPEQGTEVVLTLPAA